MTADDLRRLIDEFLDAVPASFTDDDLHAHLVAQGAGDAEAKMAVEDWARENDGEPGMADLERLVTSLDVPPDWRQCTPDQLHRVAEGLRIASDEARAASARLQGTTAQLVAAMRESGAGTVGELPNDLQPIAYAHLVAHNEHVEAERIARTFMLYVGAVTP